VFPEGFRRVPTRGFRKGGLRESSTSGVYRGGPVDGSPPREAQRGGPDGSPPRGDQRWGEAEVVSNRAVFCKLCIGSSHEGGPQRGVRRAGTAVRGSMGDSPRGSFKGSREEGRTEASGEGSTEGGPPSLVRRGGPRGACR
jgi:hypothetical protein